MKKKEELANDSEALVPLSEPVDGETVVAYTKAQYRTSSRFTLAQKDILSAVLEDGETYTIDAANKAIETYLNRSVK